MDRGTLYHLRNRLHRSNVPSVPKKDFNACEDFIYTVTSSYVVAAALATFDLKSTTDTPNDSVVKDADNVWMKDIGERRALLEKLCMKVFRQICLTFFWSTIQRFCSLPQ